MKSSEIWTSILEDRKTKLVAMKKEQEELERKYDVMSYEEDMYYYLAQRHSKYKNIFEKKQTSSDEAMKQVYNEKEKLFEKIKLLNMEIEYIEERLPSFTK